VSVGILHTRYKQGNSSTHSCLIGSIQHVQGRCGTASAWAIGPVLACWAGGATAVTS
jgi:hypothetical protein